jgi:hypothetical protein
MALIVETGAGVSNADSWVSLANATTHFANYGGFWTGADAAKEQALRRAALWLSTFIRWNGAKAYTGNMLAWPRIGMMDCDGNSIAENTIPPQIVMAQLAAASAELQSPGILTPSITPGAQTKREKVDVIEVEYMTPKDMGFPDSTYDPLMQLRPVLTQVSDYIRCFASTGKAAAWPFVV